MGITRFIYILFFLSCIFLLYNKKNDIVKVETQEKPMATFDNSVIYDISTVGISKVIQLDKALVYKTFTELYNATFVFKNENQSNENTLNARHIIKIDDELFLDGDVNLQSGDIFNLRTEELQYNMATQIAKNNKEFILLSKESSFKGEELFFDRNINKIVANKIHFKLRLKDQNDSK